ncbi:MAG: nucleotide exchange factor GrpE [Candidatus Eremiobacteraeota bacterium]|nr:nucleotide exchange factor GrpE [Candidatus Eremiobacteraeota bacterium]
MQEENTAAVDRNGATDDPVGAADPSAELAAANAKADENYNKFLLAMADFENYKKRMQRDFETNVLRARMTLLQRFLPVVDNLERALQFEESSAGLRSGVEQTLKGFEALLAGEGIKPIKVLGEAFDPKVAEAIGTQPRPDVPEDTVVEEAQKGYAWGDEVLRPAKVIVAKAHDQ